MTKISDIALKAYFETGDVPTQAEFTDLIDSMQNVSDYTAHSILQATTEKTPVAITIPEQTLVGRITGGNIKALTVGETRLMLGITTITYPATSLNVVTSDGFTGNIDSVDTVNDADILQVEEAVGSPGFDIRFTFTNVVAFNNILMRQYYHGDANHSIHIELYNVDTTDWDDVFEFTDEEGFNYHSIPVYEGYNYINPSNEVILRVHHDDSGIPSHQMEIDYVGLNDMPQIGSGGGVTAHFALNHLDYASAGHKGFAPIASPTFTGTVTTPSLIVTDLSDGKVPYQNAATDKLADTLLNYDGTSFSISTSTHNVGDQTALFSIINTDINAVDGNALLVRGGAHDNSGETFEVQDYAGNSDFVVLGNGIVEIRENVLKVNTIEDYNGNLVTIANDTAITGNLAQTVAGSLTFEMKSTTTGNPLIKLNGYRLGSDANITQIVSYNNGDSVAVIQVTRDGNDDAANLELWTQPTGGNTTRRFYISSDGTIHNLGNTDITGALAVSDIISATLAIYNDNAAAISGGLSAKDFYRTGADPDLVCIVH